jgi:YfiH family protein
MFDEADVYQFSLDYTNHIHGKPLFASFPFIMDSNPVKGISCGISSIYAGDMKYESENKNRSVLFVELGLNPINVYGLKQIHSRNVLAVDSGNPPAVDADGMVTHDRNITLSVTVADCLPVFLLDVKSGIFGLVHSGWKGTGIAVNALFLMRECYGTNPSDVAAVLGPCIASCCYRVDEQRASVFEKDFGEESVRKTEGGYFLDLKRANISLLKNAGVKNIAVCGECTFCDERLGSFRREGSRFMHMAALANC